MNLLENVYLPDFKKRQIRDSEAYKLLEKNGMDTSPLEGNYEEKAINVKMKDFDSYINEGGTKEDWVALHADKETQKEFFGTIGDFLVDTGKDTVLSLGVAAINGADVATNLMPVVAKLLDNSPLATAMPNGFMNAETEEQIYNAAKTASDNLGKARDYLKSFKEDDNIVSQLIGVMGQDLVYSVPMYKALRNAGVPQYPAFFISGGVGGAIGIEEKVLGEDSTFSKSLFAKDIKALKDLVGILPNTPEDKIADEVVQALEYGAFSTAIPAVIDSFKFMKRYIPAFAGGAAITTMPGDDAEASPIKAITNAVKNVPIFKSAVQDAVEKKVTKGNAEQIYNTIKNTPGVKESELKWLGLEDQLKVFGRANKKQFTQEEILNFIESNRIDVSEVMFGGPTSKISTELAEEVEFAKNEFERKVLEDIYKKDPGMIGEVPEELLEEINYDVYRIRFDNDPSGTMDFNTLQTLLGDNPDPSKLFKKELVNGKYEMNIPDETRTIAFGSGRLSSNKFYIDPMEFEKFTVEQKVRKARGVSNAPRFRDYTEPGGEDYTELVFKIKKGGMDIGIPVEIRNAETTTIKNNPFRSPNHMNVKNEIAHVRFKSRNLDGKKVLTVEEMQSDFNIRAAKENRVFGGEKPKIADFPFKNTWYEMTIRRLIRYAADNGFDAVAIPKAEVPAKRYREYIDKVKKLIVQKDDNNIVVRYFDEDGMDVAERVFDIDNLNLIQKDIGPKKFNELNELVRKLKTNIGEAELNLEKEIIIGSGKGKAKLYDEAIPAYMKKYGKKWNAKVYENEIDLGLALGSTETGSLPVTILDITPEMKKSVQGTPQPLFSYFGGTVLGAELVSDTIQNNIISDQTN